MKKVISVISLAAVLLFTSYANAEIKVGVIDVMSILQKMPQREQVIKLLDKEFDARAKALQENEKQASAASAKLKKDSLTLSASEKAKLNKIVLDFESKANEFTVDYRKRETEEAGKLIVKIENAVNQIVNEEHYALILKAEATLFVSDAVNISEKVLEKVKK